METRICTTCKKEKDVEEFYIRKRGTDKRKSVCKYCDKQTKVRPIIEIPNLDGEIWVDAPGYDGVYLVSNKCRFRRIMHRANPTNKLMGCRLYGDNEYIQVTLCLNGKAIAHSAHRLVAIAFIPNPENKPEVNHKNGVKTDNWVENLEWATESENQLHAYETGLQIARKGEDCHFSKLTEKQVIEIREIGKSMKQWQIAEIYGVDRRQVGKILNGQRWKHIQ